MPSALSRAIVCNECPRRRCNMLTLWKPIFLNKAAKNARGCKVSPIRAFRSVKRVSDIPRIPVFKKYYFQKLVSLVE